jgi:hypothetical protein
MRTGQGSPEAVRMGRREVRAALAGTTREVARDPAAESIPSAGFSLEGCFPSASSFPRTRVLLTEP